MITAVIGAGVGLVAIVIGILAGRAIQRRRHARASGVATDVMADARGRARQLLDRAEAEAVAKAEAFRDREVAALEQRKLESDSHEERLAQREATLEQRASNLAQRESLLMEREATLAEVRLDAERLREEARGELERAAGFDSKAAKDELLRRVEDEGRRDAMVL